MSILKAFTNLSGNEDLLKTLPDTSEQALQELTLQRTLGVSLLAAKGYGAPEVEQAYTRARELCEQVGDTSLFFPVLWGLALFHLVRAELQTACEIGGQLLNLGQGHQNRHILLGGHITLGMPLFQLGELPLAREHFDRGMTLYTSLKHHADMSLYGLDPGVMCLSYGSWALWFLGYAALALEGSQHALVLAREAPHPYSLVFALAFAARLHQCRHEEQAVYELAEAMIAISREQGLPYYLAQGMILQGWSLTMQGRGEEGLEQMLQGLVALRATGTELGQLGFLLQLAEGYRKTGQTEKALTVIDASLELMDRNGVRCWEAQQYRLKGELLLARRAKNLYDERVWGGLHTWEHRKRTVILLS